MKKNNKTALITGASRGLGKALATHLAERGWRLLLTARHARPLYEVQQTLRRLTTVEAVAGDVIDEIHLLQLPERAAAFGGLDLVVNNASTLGASPQPLLLDYSIDVIHTIFHTNVIAPLSLLQKLRSQLKADARIINVSSDAAVAAYAGWGGYGASKAALDHLSAILAAENPLWHVYWVDPGDMRTQMHQEAFPGEDISDRPLPASVLPAFDLLIEGNRPSGRYIASQLLQEVPKIALPTPYPPRFSPFQAGLSLK